MATAKKSATKKATPKKTAAQNFAHEILKSLKWQRGEDDGEVTIDVGGMEFKPKDIVNPKILQRVDRIDPKCILVTDGEEVTIQPNQEIKFIPALRYDHDKWNQTILTAADLTLNQISVYDPNEDGGEGRWVGNVPALIGAGYREVNVFPDGTLRIGCQRHPFANWPQEADRRLMGRPDTLATLNALLPLLTTFLVSHKPPKTSKKTEPITAAGVRQILLDRLSAPVPMKKKAVRKKTAAKRK